ncbi:GNAT family N-acetyltransferase [Candidatus Gracilibacteria bacterium]|nr:GNAT family N-acetyltransferase [Candidatus Gracilibacteria bacterium]
MERIIYLKGKVISLVVPEKQDVDLMYKGMNDYEIAKNITSRALSPAYRENEEAYYNSFSLNKDKTFMIMINKTKEVIGNLGFIKLNELARNGEIGICIFDKKYFGKGYGTEAIKLFLKYGFELIGLNKALDQKMKINIIWSYDKIQ